MREIKVSESESLWYLPDGRIEYTKYKSITYIGRLDGAKHKFRDMECEHIFSQAVGKIRKRVAIGQEYWLTCNQMLSKVNGYNMPIEPVTDRITEVVAIPKINEYPNEIYEVDYFEGLLLQLRTYSGMFIRSASKKSLKSKLIAFKNNIRLSHFKTLLKMFCLFVAGLMVAGVVVQVLNKLS